MNVDLHPSTQGFEPPLRSAPLLQRGSMTPTPWRGLRSAWRLGIQGAAALDAGDGTTPLWQQAAQRRRWRVLMWVLGAALLALVGLALQDPRIGSDFWPSAQALLFALLFGWIAAGFATAVMGFRSLLHGDRHGLRAASLGTNAAIDTAARTAVIMPICNEDLGTVFGGLRATIESLQQAGHAELFDFYVLSDTNRPELQRAEVQAWQALREALGTETGARLHYRWRRVRSKRKAGNVADFCRRWGREHRYMVVLDADSVMSGAALVQLLRLMEAHPRAGILQTLPRPCGLETLHARAQQFIGRVSGRVFAAGLQYWQLGESHYWGHNAILRIEPFMRHCALAKLPGRGGLSGEILSHDFVEAALMRRAGFEVWLVPDIDGSYEQQPPHLIEELQRDRRWCQGNLQNARLIAEPGLAGVHRAMLGVGALSYLMAPLWLAFVLIGLLPWLLGDEPSAAQSAGPSAVLWAVTLAMLFIPRVLGVLAVQIKREQAFYGGSARLWASAMLEAVLSALQAPVRMLAHTLFVLGALTGLQLHWKSPARESASVGWREAARRFGLGTVLSAAALAWWLAGAPDEAWRLAPLALPLLLGIPFAVWTSRPALGAAARRRGLLLIPEESRPPAVLLSAWRHAQAPVTDVVAPGFAPAVVTRPRAVGAWSLGRAFAPAMLMIGLGLGTAMPVTVATGELSEHQVAAMRIIEQASLPSASPRVVSVGVRLAPRDLRPVKAPVPIALRARDLSA